MTPNYWHRVNPDGTATVYLGERYVTKYRTEEEAKEHIEKAKKSASTKK